MHAVSGRTTSSQSMEFSSWSMRAIETEWRSPKKSWTGFLNLQHFKMYRSWYWETKSTKWERRQKKSWESFSDCCHTWRQEGRRREEWKEFVRSKCSCAAWRSEWDMRRRSTGSTTSSLEAVLFYIRQMPRFISMKKLSYSSSGHHSERLISLRLNQTISLGSVRAVFIIKCSSSDTAAGSNHLSEVIPYLCLHHYYLFLP